MKKSLHLYNNWKVNVLGYFLQAIKEVMKIRAPHDMMLPDRGSKVMK